MLLPPPRARTLLLLALLPWPLVALALYGFGRFDLAFLLYHGLCLGAAACYGRGHLRGYPHWRPVLAGSLALGVATFLVVGHVVDPAQLRTAVSRFGMSAGHLPLVGMWFIVVNPLSEEAFWRGTVLDGLQRAWSPWPARLVSSFLFGAWHWLVIQAALPGMAALSTLAVMVFGVFMAAIYERADRGLVPGALVHGLGGDLPLFLLLLSAFSRR